MPPAWEAFLLLRPPGTKSSLTRNIIESLKY
jgi:hypothetical protein